MALSYELIVNDSMFKQFSDLPITVTENPDDLDPISGKLYKEYSTLNNTNLVIQSIIGAIELELDDIVKNAKVYNSIFCIDYKNYIEILAYYKVENV